METFSALLATCAGNSPVPGKVPAQRPGALMFSLICTWLNGWVSNGEADDSSMHCRDTKHHDLIIDILLLLLQ